MKKQKNSNTVMRKAFFAFLNGNITREEMYRYQELKRELMGNHPFVVQDDRPEWVEFNTIISKIQQMYNR